MHKYPHNGGFDLHSVLFGVCLLHCALIYSCHTCTSVAYTMAFQCMRYNT